MKHNATKRALLADLGPRLKPHGFGARPVGQTHRRGFPLGRQAVHLSFIDHDEDFDVTVDVAVRFDAVEGLVHRTNSLLSKSEKAQTYTLGAELGNIERREPRRWTVGSPANVSTTAVAIEASLLGVGFPYLNMYSDPHVALAMLARDDQEAWLHSPIDAERAKRAVALLVMVGRPEELGDLGRRKMEYLESVGDRGLAGFRRFWEALRGDLEVRVGEIGF